VERTSSPLNGPRTEAADELFLKREKNRHHGHRHQEGSGHRASPVDREHSRKFGQPDRQGFGVVGVRQHGRENELVPGHEEREQRDRYDAWHGHRQNDLS